MEEMKKMKQMGGQEEGLGKRGSKWGIQREEQGEKGRQNVGEGKRQKERKIEVEGRK